MLADKKLAAIDVRICSTSNSAMLVDKKVLSNAITPALKVEVFGLKILRHRGTASQSFIRERTREMFATSVS